MDSNIIPVITWEQNIVATAIVRACKGFWSLKGDIDGGVWQLNLCEDNGEKMNSAFRQMMASIDLED